MVPEFCDDDDKVHGSRKEVRKSIDSDPQDSQIFAWCKRNRDSSRTARLFFELVDRDAPESSHDSDIESWLLSCHQSGDRDATAVLGMMLILGIGAVLTQTA